MSAATAPRGERRIVPSINLDLDYFDHPKVNRLIGLLGKGAAVLPIRLWCYCGKYHAADGSLTSYSTLEIETVIGWWGKPGEAAAALLKVGFIDEVTGYGFLVHDWTEHAGHLDAAKAKAKSMAKARWARLKGGCGPPPDAVSNACSIADSNAASIAPSNATAGQGSAAQGKASEIFPRLSAREPPAYSDDAAGLAEEFVFHSTNTIRGGMKVEQPKDVAAKIQDLLKAGVTAAAIKAEIHRKDRPRSEWASKFTDRLMPKVVNVRPGVSNDRTKARFRPEQAARFYGAVEGGGGSTDGATG